MRLSQNSICEMLKAASASRPENAQIGNSTQHAVHEEAVQDHISAARRCGIASDYVVSDRATETIATAFSVEPEQMVAIGGRLDGPELPDQAAFDKDVAHRHSPVADAYADEPRRVRGLSNSSVLSQADSLRRPLGIFS